MGLLDRLRAKNERTPAEIIFPVILKAPVGGTLAPMEALKDPVFAEGVLGFCCGVEPIEGKVFAPVDGKVIQVADTYHAVSLETSGVEILIHVGVDTVKMKGDGFFSHVKIDQSVRAGDLLLTMDLEKIRAANHAATVIVSVTNSEDFSSVELIGTETVKIGDAILQINK